MGKLSSANEKDGKYPFYWHLSLVIIREHATKSHPLALMYIEYQNTRWPPLLSNQGYKVILWDSGVDFNVLGI